MKHNLGVKEETKNKRMMLFSGSSAPELSEKIAEDLDIKLGKVSSEKSSFAFALINNPSAAANLASVKIDIPKQKISPAAPLTGCACNGKCNGSCDDICSGVCNIKTLAAINESTTVSALPHFVFVTFVRSLTTKSHLKNYHVSNSSFVYPLPPAQAQRTYEPFAAVLHAGTATAGHARTLALHKEHAVWMIADDDKPIASVPTFTSRDDIVQMYRFCVKKVKECTLSCTNVFHF